MLSVCHVTLVLTAVWGTVSVQGVALGSGAPWRLEQAVAPAPLLRSRRQILPGIGMPCLTVSFLTDLKGRFEERIDPNKDGRAAESEVGQFLANFNPAITNRQVARFIARRDLNGNGQIEFIPEYVVDIATPDMTEEAADEWFRLEDRNRDGYVSRQELLTISQRLGMNAQQAADGVSSYYMSADTDGDDRLSFDEYKVLYGQ